ncbi:MAG: guanylate kinase [Flavobacteriaceae bacterium]
MKNGKLFVFSAPSGSGKTTLVHHLLQQNLPLGFSISATSRAPRGEEVNGKDYYFLTEEEFRKKIEEDAFVEHEEVYKGALYGTLRSEIDRLWEEGKHVLFDIDVVGGLNVKAQYPENTLSIFVQPPSLDELENRLRSRGTESEEKIQQRLDKSAKELVYAQDFDVILVNDELNKAKQEVVRLVKRHLQS